MNVRVGYEKTGRAKYISHLDMMRCMGRTLARAGLPVWYTQGFNPHIYMTFAQPLSLGVESHCETVDFRLEEELPMDQVVSRINACLPEGIRALWAGEPVNQPEDIAWADYTIRMVFDGMDGKELGERFAALCQSPSILVMKRSKKGPKEVDIRPHIQLLGWEGEGESLTVSLRLAAGITFSVNPTLLLERFFEQVGRPADGISSCRTALLTGDLKEFR